MEEDETDHTETSSDESEFDHEEIKSWWDLAKKFRKVSNTILEYHKKLERLEKKHNKSNKNQIEMAKLLQNHTGQLTQINKRIESEVKLKVLEKFEQMRNN